jgi:ribosomal protein S18 acetylase RimI-like enzyme
MIFISTATLEDLEQLVPLFNAYRVFYRKASEPDKVSHFLQERIRLHESVIYMAYDDKKAVGFTQLYPLFSSTRMQRLWLLNDLFVDTNYRGRGISKQLIDKAKDLVRNTQAAGVSLETEKTNKIGNQLYPSTGFEIDEEHNYYFWTNDNKI